jgi:hypothetical protein
MARDNGFLSPLFDKIIKLIYVTILISYFRFLMEKKVKPVMGIPAKEYLEQVANNVMVDVPEELEASYDRFHVNPRNVPDVIIAKSTLPLVNEKACMTPIQRRRIRLAIYSLPCRSEPEVLSLATVINSFRLDCQDCLRENCDMRDPATSLKSESEGTIERVGSMTVGELLDELLDEIEDERYKMVRERAMGGFIGDRFRGEDPIKTVDDLLKRRPRDLLIREGFGKKSLELVRIALAKHGLALRGDKIDMRDFKYSQTKPSPLELSTDEKTVALRAALSLSTIRSLETLGVAKVADLSGFSDEELRRNLGRKGFNNLSESLIIAGLKPPKECKGAESLASFGIPKRLFGFLKGAGVVTVSDLERKSESEIRGINNIGQTYVSCLRHVLLVHGRKFREQG